MQKYLNCSKVYYFLLDMCFLYEEMTRDTVRAFPEPSDGSRICCYGATVAPLLTKWGPISMQKGVQVAEWLARWPLTNAARVRFLAGDLIPAP